MNVRLWGGGVARQSRVCPALLDDLSSPRSRIKKLIIIQPSLALGPEESGAFGLRGHLTCKYLHLDTYTHT